MRIIVEKNSLYNEKFIRWLVRKVREEIILESDSHELSRMSSYLFTVTNIPINLCDVLIESTKNIVYISSKNNYHIFINPIKMYRNTGYKLITLAKFIDYGNADIKGCLVYSIVSYRINSRLDEYFNEYLVSMGVQ